MAFQINGQTVIDNSRVASSMTGIPGLAHDETTWNNASYQFGGFSSYAAGTVNFATQSIQPDNFSDFNNLYIDITSNILSGDGSTYGDNVIIRLDGNTGSDTWTIIPSSHQWRIDSRCIIAMRKTDNGFHIETWLTPSNYDVDANYPKELNLQDARWAGDGFVSNTSESFDSIAITWPSWGGGTGNRLVHSVQWR